MTIELSAVLIVKNESKVISRCLRSLTGVSEIVVLGTGSTDGTEKLAHELGAKVQVREWPAPFHFSEARNLANTFATHDWVMSIDADEVLRSGMVRRLKAAIRDHPDHSAIRITFTDRGAVTHKIKVYRKSVWSWRYRVHEQLHSITEGVDVLEMPSVVMEHLPEPDKARRHYQNVELLNITVKENPEYARAWRHLGQEYMLDKEWKEAIPYLAEYVERTQENVLEKSEVMMHLGECYAQSSDMESALKWFEAAATTDPRRREPLYHAAWWKIKTAKTPQDLEQASRYLKKCVERDIKLRPGVVTDAKNMDPYSPLNQPAVWGNEPLRMIQFCADELRKAMI